MTRYQRELDENVQFAIEKGNHLLKKGKDPWVLFYVGASYGYRAFNRFRKHDWIGAYGDGKKGIKLLGEALKLDPKIYDVYLGLGSYHYWRTAKSDFIRIIAFWIPDKRELGLRQLEFSSLYGTYSRTEASYALINSLFDYGRYDKAHRILDRMISKKRDLTTTDLYYKGRLLIKDRNWNEAESTFRTLLGRIESNIGSSIGYRVECKYWIAYSLKEMGRRAEAYEITKEAFSQSDDRDVEKELEGPFENFKEIRKGLKTFLFELKG
jgi:pentatricopeptide repeat protein